MPQTLHFAALSGKSFDKAQRALQAAFGEALRDLQLGEGADAATDAASDASTDAQGQPVAHSGDGDEWAYLSATLADGTQLSLTRTDGFDTIATWVAGAPTGVNWQLMLTREAGLDTTRVEQVCEALHAALGARLAVYRMA